jgi:hypothetical protein
LERRPPMSKIKMICRVVFFPLVVMGFVVRFVEWLVTDSDWDEV